MVHLRGGRLFCALLLCFLAITTAQNSSITYPFIAERGSANCTIQTKLFPRDIQTQIFTGSAFLVAQGAQAFNVSQTCLDVGLAATATGCQEDLLIQDGCCSPACAAGWKVGEDNPQTAGCFEVAIFRICAAVTSGRLPPGAPLEAIPAMYLSVASMRKRCVTGRDYACPAIPASLPGGGGTPLPTALSPPPVAAPVPVSPVVTTPTPTPTPSPIPTPSVPQPSPVTQSPTTSESKSKNTVAIAAGVAGGVGLAVLAGLAIWVFVNRSKKVKAARAMSTEALSPKDDVPSHSSRGPGGASVAPANDAALAGDGQVAVVIRKSEKRGSTPGENTHQQQTTVALTSASDRSASGPGPSNAPPQQSISGLAPGSESNTGVPGAGGVMITPSQTGGPHSSTNVGYTGSSAFQTPAATGALQSSFASPPHSASGRQLVSAGGSLGGATLSYRPSVTSTQGPLPSVPGSLSAFSLEDEIAYQRGALSRMQIQWSTVKTGRELGGGGFGTVYKGQWQGNTVAVKMLKVKEITPAQRIELRREALAMFEKPHPCVATIYGMVDEEERCALVMRYYRNGSVSQVFRNGKYQQVAQITRVKFALQVAAGMCCLHERNMIHGDLKTGNLLVSDDFHSVVITDFGLAGIQGQAVSSGALTVHISPPEVLQNPKAPRTQSCDVYAFGIVMLELLIGRHAFANMLRNAIKSVVISGNRPVIPEQVPPELAAIITSCWAQKPEDRPTFTEVLVRLDSAMGAMGGAQVTTLSGNTTTEWL